MLQKNKGAFKMHSHTHSQSNTSHKAIQNDHHSEPETTTTKKHGLSKPNALTFHSILFVLSHHVMKSVFAMFKTVTNSFVSVL